MNCRFAVLLLAVLGATGCLRDDRASRSRGAAGIFENVPVYRAPLTNRCTNFAKGSAPAGACEEAKYLGELYVRRLSSGDEVCLEGGFGDPPSGACLCRASVADVATGQVLLEVRETKPDSKWFQKDQNQFWFEEDALVDLYLADHGY